MNQLKKFYFAIAFCIFHLATVEGDGALISTHPQHSYADTENIGNLEDTLRNMLSNQDKYSFSRGWWDWDRLRQRYVDSERKDENSLRILRGVFRGLIIDWHTKLEAKGEDDLMYILFTTNSGNKTTRNADEGRKLVRDLHGGGYHGGWGSACRIRIYEELVRQNMLTPEEKELFKKIVHQSLQPQFLDFTKGSQQADNHSFGNGGGVALALKLFPNAPQAKEARDWLDRIWANLADYGDWTEWNYYPYGPIFLHGMLDIAEATGRINTDHALINAIGQRCLGFIHGGGIRGNPNCGSQVRKDLSQVYADPWNMGYYNVETSSRDGNFWYRMAQHYKDPEYLWAAEQVALGGRPPDGNVPAEYQAAYNKRFAWFVKHDIEPKLPASSSKIGLLSAFKHKIKERVYLNSGREPEKPFAAFFLYDKKDKHLDNVAGYLYEYSINGVKLLHTSGKYNNVYSDKKLKGGGTGEESLDSLLVLHKRHPFPIHPDRQGDERDFKRIDFAKHLPDLAKAENNSSGDSFGQFGFKDFFGPGSQWIRRVILTAEGYLIVADEYKGDASLGADYLAGPIWHLAKVEGKTTGLQAKNWFAAPAIDRSWWQKKEIGVTVYIHDDSNLKFGSGQQSQSQDVAQNTTVFAYRPITAGKPELFLSILVPHCLAKCPDTVVRNIKSVIKQSRTFITSIYGVQVIIESNGGWYVER